MGYHFVVALLAVHATAESRGLLDNPIRGDANIAQYLDGEGWIVTGTDSSGAPLSVGARVPSDLLSDLEYSGLIGDPLSELNFRNTIWDKVWTYTLAFDLDPSIFKSWSSGGGVSLVFDSVKMGGYVTLNGVLMGNCSDQFLRYSFGVGALLTPTGNVLSVAFMPSNHTLNDDGRWMGCSGAWDWAPYGTTFSAQGDHTFSKGLVKSVYMVPITAAAIAHIVPRIYYTGGYEIVPLAGRTPAPFNVSVDVVFTSIGGGTGVVSADCEWAMGSGPVTQHAVLGAGDTVVTLTLPVATGIDLWWPATLGGHRRYAINITFTPDGPSGSALACSDTRSVGFRVLHLVTVEDAVPSVYAGLDGSGNFTMRWKVNGANFYARGANMIPMEEMEGRQSGAAYVALLDSAVAAGHNTLRVWGGGLYLPDVFYDTADATGLLVYHDLMYGTPWNGGTGGVPTPSVKQANEITHAIRRLASHPCIAMWNGGNEDLGRWGVDGNALITTFLTPTIAAVDDSRPVWPTSPSQGWMGGVDRLTGLPNGLPYRLSNNTGETFETHGPYQHGAGFATVNGQAAINLFDANMPPALNSPSTQKYGPNASGTFASEFGCSVFSSFESMSPTLSPAHWGAHSAPMTQRNYPTDNIVQVYFGVGATASLNDTGTRAFQQATYLGMLGSALQQKSDIEVRRSGNVWGTLTWQLGEIWPTGGWGSLEYGTVGYTPGQVLGGRWKPLHHWMDTHLYRPQILVCGASGACLVKNDDPLTAVNVSWSTAFLRVSDGKVTGVGAGSASLGIGAGTGTWRCADGITSPPWSVSIVAIAPFAGRMCTRWLGLCAVLHAAGQCGRGCTRLARGTADTTWQHDNSEDYSLCSSGPRSQRGRKYQCHCDGKQWGYGHVRYPHDPGSRSVQRQRLLHTRRHKRGRGPCWDCGTHFQAYCRRGSARHGPADRHSAH